MSRIKELEGFICTLREANNKLSPDDPDVSSIDQQPERYQKWFKIWKMKCLA